MLETETTLERILSELEQADSLDGMQSVSEALRDYYDVDHLVYHWVDSRGDQYGCGTYSEEWQNKYVAENYLRIDPVVQGCYRRFHPVDWKRLDWSSKAAREFLRVSAEYGVGNQGISIPIRGPNGQFAMFTVNTSCDDDTWERFSEENRRDLILIAHYFNEKALEFEPERQPEQSQSLSPREVDAMTLLAIGYSRAQVANSLSISEHTLRVYIESARFKLGALNTTHAVARAMSRGLIVI
ncbi:autoinducer binding domain-containing protein [Sulfitobacter sp. F26169L]|uniref:helix-turn-helix transcriptional regulator n=1 Tax=Sulfitobacter sp. F26169L TaxID=2996015 RepID=UPI002260F05D|nr:autoinducer binding domain-containing protein [Sulfitobacter sp. F26169L]MCX7567207.1 autoinducer binding domain-containing protein [Sulfitobacter sp. F26169L]